MMTILSGIVKLIIVLMPLKRVQFETHRFQGSIRVSGWWTPG